MHLSEAQKKYLRGLGHQIRPVITVGDAGLSPSLMKEFDSAISYHELIKVRIRAANRETRDALLQELCRRRSAHLVQRVGNVALLYRSNPDEPRIRLPPTRNESR